MNLDSVLFAVADTDVEARPDLRTQKVPEQAMISIPPFRIIGRIHVLPERGLGEALSELTGKFIPVTEATYWSDVVGEARHTAPMVAINHRRAQILAPHREVDPWAGVDRSGASASSSSAAPAAGPSPVAPATSPSPAGPATSPSPAGDPAWPEADRAPGS